VDAVGLHVGGERRAAVLERGQGAEEIGVEPGAVDRGEFGEDRVEPRLVVGAIVAGGGHADEKDRQVTRCGGLQDAVEIGAGHGRVDAAQEVVAAQRDDERIDIRRQGPVDAGEPALGRIARDSPH
jgi:hypothetical protein